RMKHLLAAILLLITVPLWGQTARDNFGTEFYIGFGANQGSSDSVNMMSLYLTSRTPASGTVTIDSLSFSQSFTTTPGSLTRIDLPSASGVRSVELTLSETIAKGLGVHVTSDNEIEIFAQK